MVESGEAVGADEVALGALLDGGRDVVQADRALKQGEHGLVVHHAGIHVHGDQVCVTAMKTVLQFCISYFHLSKDGEIICHLSPNCLSWFIMHRLRFFSFRFPS